MSIQTDNFSEQRIIDAAPASPNEEAIERALRPKHLDEYVGQSKIRDQLEIFISAARKRREALIGALFAAQGFDAIDLSQDELAKAHLRHLVGGRSELAVNERLFRFEFPERPGALTRFLSSMHPDWNISLFHYRNQGADYGRILVGIQVPASDSQAFDDFLATLGYPYVEETANPVFRMFLQH